MKDPSLLLQDKPREAFDVEADAGENDAPHIEMVRLPSASCLLDAPMLLLPLSLICEDSSPEAVGLIC